MHQCTVESNRPRLTGGLHLTMAHSSCDPFAHLSTALQPHLLPHTSCAGMNAASVGLILASVFRMTLDVYSISPFPTAALCIGLFAFAAVDQLNIFEPFVVAGGIVLGFIAWGAKMY